MNKLRKKYWDFSDKHPKFNRTIDKLYQVTDKFMVFYTIFLIVLTVAIPSICAYIILDESIRKLITPIVSAIFSVIVVPVVLNYISQKKENEAKLYEINKPFYDELCRIIVELIKKDSYEENDVNIVKSFLEKNYSQMCTSMETSFISDVYLIYRETRNNSKENILYYSEKCVKSIRKQIGVKGDFYFSQLIFETIKEKKIK